MGTETTKTVNRLSSTRTIPPLESGDELTRAEFERRYAAMPDDRKAELIEGVVYVSSPVSLRHGEPDGLLHGVLSLYALSTPGVQFLPNATLRLDDRNEPQPDALLRVLPAAGGISRDDSDDYLSGGVELVAEVAGSRASPDLHRKMDVYRRFGCLEYVVVVAHEREVCWFALRGGAYEPVTPDAQGIIRSSVFPGLWLATGALLADDGVRLLETARAGIASSERAAFAARLASAH